MIISEQIKIPETAELTSEYIETKLNELGIEPLRWAIVDVVDGNYVLSVSFEKVD